MFTRFRASAALVFFGIFVAAQPALAQQTAAGRYAFTQDYEPSPALWILADDDTTIYMLGTFHALPRNFRWRSEQLNHIVDQVDALYVETTDYDYSLEEIDIDTKFAARLANRSPTSQQLSEAAQEQWAELVRLSGQDYQSIDTMPILLALLTMGTSTGEAAWMSSYAYGVETVLEQEFAASGRPIRAIEDSGAVMYSLLRHDGEELIEELEHRLLSWDGKSIGAFYDEEFIEETGDAYWREEHDWARGVVADEFDLGFGDGPIGEAFVYNLLDRRNAQWTDWIEAKLEEPGNILLAVGAGHFEGEASLLEMLEERGIPAQRIE